MSNPRNVNQMLQSAVATQPAKLPGIPAVQVADRAVSDVLKAMKERLEVREGERGNPFEGTVTMRQMDELGLVRTTPAPCRVTELAGMTGQTKAGEFVQVKIADLADAVKAASFGDAIKTIDESKKEADTIKNEIASLSARVASFGQGGSSLMAIQQLEAVMNAKAAVYDAAIETARAKIEQYDAAIAVAEQKIAQYDAAIVTANAKFAEYDALVASGSAIVNGIDQGTRAITVNPSSVLRSYPYNPPYREWEWNPTVDNLLERVLNHGARLDAHGI